MTENTGTIKQAWGTKRARQGTWALALCTYVLLLCLGSYLRLQEQDLRQNNIIQSARMLASTVLSTGGESNDILLRVSDLLNVNSVLGVRLLQGADSPLSVGETQNNFPPQGTSQNVLVQWDDLFEKADIALRLDNNLPYDWLVLRLDGARLSPPSHWGTLLNWVVAPIFAGLIAFLNLWLWGKMHLRPMQAIQSYLQEHSGKLASTPLPQDLTKGEDQVSLLARQIEAMRVEVSEAKAKSDFQARFLHETPYALLRCSVNRKVLYANSAARSQQALFGDDSKEFVAPALSELVRKAFYESKEVFGDIRNKDHIITFRAVPVLDAGYVNLYGEAKRHMDDDI
ncbi:MAG: hypothetical protein ACNI26_17140 [Terasakiella sp.]|uniref:hypothetical protein n=1 Tax=unclassified Terasakiella TaxID=2614952 RepID=UPI003B006A6E